MVHESAGDEQIDYRFLLANERTFLAWIRTALGVIAGGVALDQFVVVRSDSSVIGPLSILTVALGVVVAITGTVRWARADAVMRAGQPMGRSRGILVVGTAVASVGAALAVLLWLQR
jgi:putative membrane protein